jgi:hypothetical protein
MNNLKLAFISIVGLLSLVFAGYVVRENLETRRGAAGGGNIQLPSEVEVCLGDTETFAVSGSSNQKITSYAFDFGFDDSKVEIEDVNKTWSIFEGDLSVSSHMFANPQKNIQFNVTLRGKSLGNSSFRLLTGKSFMSGLEDDSMNISASGDTTVKVVDCDSPVNTNTPASTPTDSPAGETITISQPSSLHLCTQETGTITVSGDSGKSMSGLQLYFDYDSTRSTIKNVTFDSKWGEGGYDARNNELLVTSLYAGGNPPRSFRIGVEITGTEPGRFNFNLNESKSIVAGTTEDGKSVDIDYTGGTAVFVQDCTESTPTPTNTRPPSATNTPEPTATMPPSATNTPEPTATMPPSATNTPEPTATTEPQTGCKPCPDGTKIESKADYDCDGTVNMEDFAGWYDDYKLGSDNLYGDFNCDGILSEDDVEQWYSELPKF